MDCLSFSFSFWDFLPAMPVLKMIHYQKCYLTSRKERNSFLFPLFTLRCHYISKSLFYIQGIHNFSNHTQKGVIFNYLTGLPKIISLKFWCFSGLIDSGSRTLWLKYSRRSYCLVNTCQVIPGTCFSFTQRLIKRKKEYNWYNVYRF